MRSTQPLNDTDLMTLLAILRLEEDAYGVTLCRELTSITGRTAALASVYKTLEKLEVRGQVVSHMGEPSPERGGRAKRYVRVTPLGVRAIDMTRTLLNSLWHNVPVFTETVRKGRA